MTVVAIVTAQFSRVASERRVGIAIAAAVMTFSACILDARPGVGLWPKWVKTSWAVRAQNGVFSRSASAVPFRDTLVGFG